MLNNLKKIYLDTKNKLFSVYDILTKANLKAWKKQKLQTQMPTCDIFNKPNYKQLKVSILPD